MNDIHWNKKGGKKKHFPASLTYKLQKTKTKNTMAYFRLTEMISGCMAFTEQTL